MEPFNTQFTLTRDYLAECFDQTLPHGKNAAPNFLFPIVCFAAGAGLLYFTEQPQIVGIILIGLAGSARGHSKRHVYWHFPNIPLPKLSAPIAGLLFKAARYEDLHR